MDIKNSAPEDIEVIFGLYRSATEYQKPKFTVHWPEFDRDMVVAEINENRQWKIIIDGQVACVWATTFDDPEIWGVRNDDPAVYIHRIATHNNFRGRNLVAMIVAWAKIYALQNGKSRIRMDTVGNNRKLIAYYMQCGFDF
jgi:hypothetical protein